MGKSKTRQNTHVDMRRHRRTSSATLYTPPSKKKTISPSSIQQMKRSKSLYNSVENTPPSRNDKLSPSSIQGIVRRRTKSLYNSMEIPGSITGDSDDGENSDS